ncbi:MAG TPA: sigma-70 family RNA polymerase sigma factor [Acidimicrobiales bacterium]|nr:sigma-70 family RNA polymerase sigma factor [Acidimicrobiales bacterium]
MTGTGETELIGRLRAGDGAAFAELVRKYHASMVRVASTFVPSRAVAEEVAQDAWLGVVRGIDRFEGRSSLKTWIFRILVNRAKTAGAKEPRTTELNERDTVDGERFGPGGQWVDPPAPWTDDVDERLSAPELAAKVRAAVDELPASQRQVVTLRDIEGLSSVEVREMLDLSEGNQRVLLHRGRAKIRKALEQELGETR